MGSGASPSTPAPASTARPTRLALAGRASGALLAAAVLALAPVRAAEAAALAGPGGHLAAAKTAGPDARGADDGRGAAARDTVVVVVSAASTVTEMSRHRLEDLFLGRANSFPDGAPAEPVDQEPGSTARSAFYADYLGRTPSEIKAHWSKAIFTGRGRPPRDVSGDEAMRELVAADPSAVGYVERSSVDESLRVLRITPGGRGGS